MSKSKFVLLFLLTALMSMSILAQIDLPNSNRPCVLANEFNTITPTTYNDWEQQAALNVGTQPWSVDVGDINNDGKNDIVAANFDDGDISIYLWNASLKTWETERNMAVGANPSCVAIGDVNNDGQNDIVTGNYHFSIDQNVSIILWNKTSQTWNTQIVRSSGSRISRIAIGDVTNDGQNDIVVTCNDDYAVSIIAWNTTLQDWDAEVRQATGAGGGPRGRRRRVIQCRQASDR